MDEKVNIRVFEVVGSPFCVASGDGQLVYERVSAALKQNHPVDLSFSNVESLTSAFLNAAIGQLYSGYTEDQIRKLLEVSDINKEDLALLKRVVDSAKAYFNDPALSERARRSAAEHDDE